MAKRPRKRAIATALAAGAGYLALTAEAAGAESRTEEFEFEDSFGDTHVCDIITGQSRGDPRGDPVFGTTAVDLFNSEDPACEDASVEVTVRFPTEDGSTYDGNSDSNQTSVIHRVFSPQIADNGTLTTIHRVVFFACVHDCTATYTMQSK